jgi:hypothetical protein
MKKLIEKELSIRLRGLKDGGIIKTDAIVR